MSQTSILKVKSFDFAIRIIKLYRHVKPRFGEFEIAHQVIRADTSIGKIIREAELAESKNDFIHKLYIGLKEANEINYWLELIHATGFINKKMFDSLKRDSDEIVASVKTSKRTREKLLSFI